MFGDYIAADVLLPARHGFLPAIEAACHVMEAAGPEANARIRACPILFVGEAFGYGSGRESPARALRAAGVRALIGASFGRMFYRNALNNGMLPIECRDLVREGVKDGDLVAIDVPAATIQWKSREFRFAEVPDLLQRIITAGDLIAYGRTILQQQRISP